MNNWSEQAIFHEYLSAANPTLTPIPYCAFESEQHQTGDSRIIICNLSSQLNIDCPATSPNCLINFIRVQQGGCVESNANASSQLFYVIRGSGKTSSEFGELNWYEGDVFTVPACQQDLVHTASEDSALYWVHDGPLFYYLGATASTAIFKPTIYRRDDIYAELDKVLSLKDSSKRNRSGVLLGNPECTQTKTITPVLWALFNSIAPGQVQAPHRHNSTALDFCVSAASEGVYTLIAEKIDDNKQLINPQRADWKSGSAFVTPPGYWHSHHNESDESAIVLPVQDAGLFTYQRTLDIRFVAGGPDPV